MQEADILVVDDFYDSKHRKIFAKMKELHSECKPIDLVTMAMQSEYYEYILELMELPAGLINHVQYIRDIKNSSLQGQLISNLSEIQKQAFNSDFLETKAKVIELSQKLEKSIVSRFEFKKPSQVISKKTSFCLIDFIPLPIGAVTMLSARGGSGKSVLALQIALRAADKKIKTLAWLSEDPAYTTKYRLDKISTMTGIEINNDYLNFSDQIPFQILKKEYNAVNTNPLFFEFKTACKDYQVIIIDPLIAFYGGFENDNTDARKFMDLLTEWAKQDDKAIILIHHHAKFRINEQDARGASAFVDATRAHYTIEKNDDDKFVNIKLEKDNWGIKTFFGKEKLIQIFKDNYEKQTNEYNKSNCCDLKSLNI